MTATSAIISYAYSPRENVGSGGKYHVELAEPFCFGRIKREAGDTLCAPARSRRFDNLDGGRSADDFKRWGCKRCREIAARSGATFVVTARGREPEQFSLAPALDHGDRA